MKPAPLHCSCAGAHFSTVFTYTAPPEGEIQFRFSTSGAYRREVLSCEVCGHFVSIHDMDEGTLYAGDYLDATYCDDDGLRRTFERIAGLEPSRSDNHGRVRRILESYSRSNHWFKAAAPAATRGTRAGARRRRGRPGGRA